MKYGQQLARELSGTSESFQAASIDYKQLKKSIKRIENELANVGLDAQLLKELLSANNAVVREDSDSELETRIQKKAIAKSTSSSSLNRPKSLRKLQEAKARGSRKKHSQPRARAEYQLAGISQSQVEDFDKAADISTAGTAENPQPRIKLVFSSASSESASSEPEEDSAGKDLYNRLLRADHAHITEITSDDVDGSHSDNPAEDSQEDDVRYDRSTSGIAKSEQDILIDKLYGNGVVPQALVTPPGSPRLGGSAIASIDESDEQEADVADTVTLGGPAILLPEEVPYDLASEGDAEGDETASIASTLRGAKLSKRNGHRRPRRHHREVVIDLEYGSEFFTLLNQALSALTSLFQAEKATFLDAVNLLAKSVSATSSPNRSRNDLYSWREVFSLWVEAQIFESEYERSRGERSIAEVEKRLDWFVDQVGRRKLAKKMRSKESRKSLEQFVQLNQELLQLKRIGFANREAARKILKKHDKRLGLPASQEFSEFVDKQKQLQLGNSPESSSAMTAQAAFAKRVTSQEMTSLLFAGLTTLPHVLLTKLTEILLPIIPQIDDFACLICGDIAWRPIALDCSHKFCVRCLVKMQKRGQDACPACRAPVVLKANKDNLDHALMSFQKLWFPKEIKAKEKENKKEIEAEIVEELELNNKCIVM